MIRRVAGIVDSVGSRKGGAKRIGLSVDEWNVWHMTEHREREDPGGPFRRAPALAEDEHDLADALVVGCLLITLLRHADRVRIACLAQLVNVIPAIRTLDGGPAWLQTSAYPFADVTRSARGTVLGLEINGPTYPLDDGVLVEAIEATVVHDEDMGRLALFAVNRLDRSLTLEATLRRLDGLAVAEHSVLADPDLRASNTAAEPLRVVPRFANAATVDGDVLTVVLPPRSWNAVRLERQG
jgi:alpha-N-arabinofuranosidase